MTLSSIGLPLLNGFIGEFTILMGAWHIPIGFQLPIPFSSKARLFGPKVWTVLAVLGIVLGAAYMLWLYQRTMFGKLDKPENEALKDLDFREVLTLAPLVVLAFWIGIYPAPFMDMIGPPVKRIVQQMGETLPATATLATSRPAPAAVSSAAPARAASLSGTESSK
jgi:NADH-quinone oxidoreductase subunit M